MKATNLDRVAFSPAEFAALFGKSQTWGYRQIYAGKVKAITEHGRILIPAAEVEKILKTAGIYDGMKSKPPTSKAEIQRLAPKLKSTWQEFLRRRRDAGEIAPKKSKGSSSKAHWRTAPREEALARLSKRSPGR